MDWQPLVSKQSLQFTSRRAGQSGYGTLCRLCYYLARYGVLGLTARQVPALRRRLTGLEDQLTGFAASASGEVPGLEAEETVPAACLEAFEAALAAVVDQGLPLDSSDQPKGQMARFGTSLAYHGYAQLPCAWLTTRQQQRFRRRAYQLQAGLLEDLGGLPAGDGGLFYLPVEVFERHWEQCLQELPFRLVTSS